jgi:hypothetical protein
LSSERRSVGISQLIRILQNRQLSGIFRHALGTRFGDDNSIPDAGAELAGDRDSSVDGEHHAGLQQGPVAFLELGFFQRRVADGAAGAVGAGEAVASVDLSRLPMDILGGDPGAYGFNRRALGLDARLVGAGVRIADLADEVLAVVA